MGEPADHLGRAQCAFAQRAWRDATEAFAAADAKSALSPADLECWAMAAGLAGDDDAMLANYARLYE
ncbi:MAG TPA: hypothetical protein VI299_08585, partial [Polyangiales bacterium]